MTSMTSIKASSTSFFILFGVLFSSVQANPIGRQVGLSGDIQILTVNGTEDCEYEGKVFENGDRIKPTSNPCEDCYCITGDVKCSIINCGPPPSDNCLEAPVEGKCCPNYECASSPSKEEEKEETVSTDTEEIVTEVSTEDQQYIQDSQSGLENAEIETTETTVEPDSTTIEEQDTIVEEQEQEQEQVQALTFKEPEIEATESTFAEDSDSENSIFIQILPLQTTTIIAQTESTDDEITVSEKHEFEDVTTESFTPTEIYVTEEQSETRTTENITFEELVTSETTTEPALGEGPVTESTQTTTLENDQLAELEMSTADSHLENEATSDMPSVIEITLLDTKTDISTTEPAYLEDPKDDKLEESINEPTENSASTHKEEESLDDPAMDISEAIILTTENSATIINELGTDLITEEISLTETTTNNLDDQSEQFEIYQDPDSEMEESTYVSTSSPTEISSQEESTTEGQLTDHTQQATSDDILDMTTFKSVPSDDILDEIKFSTLGDFSEASTTTLSSDITTTTKDEIITESPEESLLENLKDEYWTTLLNTDNEGNQNTDISPVVTKGQHISAPANTIEKFETSFSENQHLDKFQVNDERFSSASEIVINEQPYIEEPVYITEKFTATEENLEQTTIPQNSQDLTTEVQHDDITTQIYNDELTTGNNKFKFEHIEIISYGTDDPIIEYVTDVSNISEYDTTTETASEINDKETTQAESNDMTTNTPDEVKRDENDDYWANMLMGKNNPIEVMKEIAKIADSSSKRNMDSTVKETATETIVPEESTLYLRSDFEITESSTSADSTDEDAEKVTENYQTEDLELTTQHIESKNEAEETSTLENITTESVEENTGEEVVESRLRQEVENNELGIFETSTTHLKEDELTSMKYATESATEDLAIATLTSNEEVTTSLINDDLISYRSAITTTNNELVEDVTDNTTINEYEEVAEMTTEGSTEAITETTSENVETKTEIQENIETKMENPLETESKISDLSASNNTKKNATVKLEEKTQIEEDSASEGSEQKTKRRESNIHIFDKILSNGSITKIKTHPSENISGEKAERISHQIHHLARKYGLRPLTKRTYRDEIQKRRVNRRRDRKSLLMRRRQ